MSEFQKLQAEIAALQKRAEAARRTERSGAIKTINELIATFEIGASELAFANSATKTKGPGRRGRKGKTDKTAEGAKRGARRAHPSAGKKVAPKFADGNGNTWAGRGQQPRWLVEAIKNGATLEQFRIAP